MADAVQMPRPMSMWDVGAVRPYGANPWNHTDSDVRKLADFILRHGFNKPIEVDEDGVILCGHRRRAAALLLGLPQVPVIQHLHLSDAEKREYRIADNRLTLDGEWDPVLTAAEVNEIAAAGGDLSYTGFTDVELAKWVEDLAHGDGVEARDGAVPVDAVPRASLADRFMVPPFSVLNAREGWWQARKRSWIALGIRSELGRGANASGFVDGSDDPGASDAREDAATPGGGQRSARSAWLTTAGPRADSIQNRARAKRADAETYGGGMGDRMAAIRSGPATAFASQDSLMSLMARRAGASGGLILESKTTSDPGFYEKKRAKEAELGRELSTEEFLARYYVPAADAIATGTSIFDPVLCEILYRWFSPPGGSVLDPFAGGSVRGVIAAKLGRRYVGVDLRAEQVEANRAQWAAMGGAAGAIVPADYTPELTPVERRGDYWFKRDDEFCVAGVRGGKVRTCWGLAQGAAGLVTAGSRKSPQCNIVASVGRALGVSVRVHTPEGALGDELTAARAAGAEVQQHPAGHNSVIIARAREDAEARGWTEIPFGMECAAAVEATAGQVANLPRDARRLVMPVGSGMSLAGVLHGMVRGGFSLPVVGVVVGANPEKRLDEYAPPGWRDMVSLVPSGVDYHDEAEETTFEGVVLDPIYEAKCIPFLQPGDCLWVVGLRQSRDPAVIAPPPGSCAPDWRVGDSVAIGDLCADVAADFVFSCPPYADLEVYSDDPRDLSTFDYPRFVAALDAIVAAACERLRPNRFAAFVVSDVRGPDGAYRNFVSDTIAAFRKAGLALYNEAILVTAVGSLPILAGRQFTATRKLGKTHQNVLVFVKGDPREATRACGVVEVALPPEEMAAAE